MKDERTYLTHAIEAIDAITDYTADGQKAFFSDGKTQDAVIRNVEIIGQAVKGISEDTRALEPAVPWRQSPECATSSFTNTSASTSFSFGMSWNGNCRSCAPNWRSCASAWPTMRPQLRGRLPNCGQRATAELTAHKTAHAPLNPAQPPLQPLSPRFVAGWNQGGAGGFSSFGIWLRGWDSEA